MRKLKSFIPASRILKQRAKQIPRSSSRPPQPTPSPPRPRSPWRSGWGAGAWRRPISRWTQATSCEASVNGLWNGVTGLGLSLWHLSQASSRLESVNADRLLYGRAASINKRKPKQQRQGRVAYGYETGVPGGGKNSLHSSCESNFQTKVCRFWSVWDSHILREGRTRFLILDSLNKRTIYIWSSICLFVVQLHGGIKKECPILNSLDKKNWWQLTIKDGWTLVVNLINITILM